MSHFPYVTRGRLYHSDGNEPLALDTPAWSSWVKEHTTFIYQDESLRFTARREKRPGGLYWYAYRRVSGKLLKRYLGRGHTLTFQRLQEVASALSKGHEEANEVSALLRTRFSI